MNSSNENVAGDDTNHVREYEAQMQTSADLSMPQEENATFMSTGQTEDEFMQGLVEFLDAPKPIQDTLMQETNETLATLIRSEKTGIPIPLPQDSVLGFEDSFSQTLSFPRQTSMAELQSTLTDTHIEKHVCADNMQQKKGEDRVQGGGTFPVEECMQCDELCKPMQTILEKLGTGIVDPGFDDLLTKIATHMQNDHARV
ncbi:hypothetical protein DM02DRAFT_635703 [Periconia macrospinosa]|uniref:Uncharacterized protein n=1 Tax=Periconia macrospinosa TaxID=97972 RepID=A0A2V1D1W5_9PLEO|nr:hypothetical protein DM02DRAFT_635703 [Periconia macrospinosa]